MQDELIPGLGSTSKKKTEKFSDFWQNFLTLKNSTYFFICVPIKNANQKFAENFS
jgi:hypothetical protein